MDRLDLPPADELRRSAALRATHLMLWGRAAFNAAVLAVVLLLCGLPSADPSPARASVVQALSLAQLTYKADEILVALPTQQRARRHADGKLIVTDFSLQVQEVLKGKSKPGATTLATVLGGRLTDLALQVPGEASFTIGERVLVFLYRTGRSRDLRVVGMAQGVLPVREDAAQRTPMVIPSGGGAALVERAEGGGLKDAESALTEPAPLADVVARVRALVAQQAR